MPEVKRRVQPIEVNYVCDACDHGMMQKVGPTDEASGETPHRCMICNHQQSFKWVHYPRIEYIAAEE